MRGLAGRGGGETLVPFVDHGAKLLAKLRQLRDALVYLGELLASQRGDGAAGGLTAPFLF